MEVFWQIRLLIAFVSSMKVYTQEVEATKHPGLRVLESASHYWPLDAVDGIRELWDQIGNRPDIVEGIVNKGIYLDGDNGGTFLHFGNYQNSCISDPSLCGPEGITFSFFWKNCEVDDAGFAIASGGKVISNGFSVYTNPKGGYVDFYTRGNNHRWKAEIEVPGPFWSHILFTWKKTDGLKVYINGTYTTGDPTGSTSESVGNINPNLVIGTSNRHTYRHYVTGAFDEFVIWERALSPRDVWLYYSGAVGQAVTFSTTPSTSKDTTLTTPSLSAAKVSPPFIGSQRDEVQSPQDPESLPVLSFLKALPNRTIPHNTANNLTQAFLNSVEEVLSSPGLQEQQSTPVVSGLIETVDRVMEHMVTNLEPSPKSLISVGGTSFVADYSLMKIPQNYNLPHYRFPTLGKNYISVPGEAFNVQSQTTIVGLFYHNMHSYYREISPVKTRINEASDFKDHHIQVASCLISLKVEPQPALSINLSGAPLIKIVLTHVLTREQQDQIVNQSNKVFLYCGFLDYRAKEGIWSNEGCVRSEGNMTYSVCLCNHLTNFAILMQVVPLKLTTGHKVALSTIGYIGCSISIFCLAITLVTFAVLSSVSTIRNQRYHIHANLSFAILVAEILLLISASFDPGTLPCKVMAVLLHFFFLSAFAWMLVEGLHLYSMVVKVFGSEDSKHFYYYGIGWGSPLVICIVSVTSALDSYGEVDNCWLSLKNGAIWAFVAPALFVIVVNIGILISVTRIISRISGENYKVHGDANAVKLTAKAVAVLLPILGISWIFGVLAVNHHSLPFLYIFAIFNSLQGFFVFLFHCLLNSEVRAAFKHKTKVWSLTSSSIRNINVKPFNSDIMNGNKEEGATPTKMNTWDKSTNSANRIDLSAV
ncbi:adhesion G-protein coupled receptor D1 isoform X5 [Synchiropus splendidus]|uniref:adhesion G-protein coupled receptor D1 isoform X5 n=1 Tax=Synchiropus splendidus TaxID=270530 RepID=UPI00237E20D5|nr:adhesion G-protein coupled receptor D1 isoform X5 [Synchiropus splendidus]